MGRRQARQCRTVEAGNNMSKTENILQQMFGEISSPGKVSLSQLSRSVGLRPATAKIKLRPLERLNLVVFEDRGRSIAINPGYGYVVGIDLGGSHLHFALADFCGEILNDSTIKIRPEDGPKKMIAQIKEGIRA